MKVICFDLDDTLSKERLYLLSAYREIAAYAVSKVRAADRASLAEEAFAAMVDAYRQGGNAFEALNARLGLQVPVSDYLQRYRNHVPDIRLPEATEALLQALQQQGVVLGLITDGRSLQQRHKIEALGLKRFFLPENIVISEEFGSEKPCEANYRYFMERYPEAEGFVYVGDNPKKDFVAPNRLGWLTVGLRDNGENIHSQSLDFPEEFLPKVWVDTLPKFLTAVSQQR